MQFAIPIFNYQVIRNSAINRAEIYIDGEILDASTQELYKEWYGDETSVSYKSFRNQLLNAGYKDVAVYVNSPGGHVGDAMAIHDLIVSLNNNGWNINTYGRGIVASSGTYIVMAGKNGGEVSPNTSWLVHNVSGGVRGNVVEIENYATSMRKFNDMIVNLYMQKTGLSKTTITDWMNAETWLMGQEIADKKFVATCSAVDAPVTNKIAPEHWPYSNKAVLSQYNSFTNKNNGNMTFKDVLNKVASVFSNTSLTNEQKQAEITNAINAAIGNMDANIDDRIKTAMNSEATRNAIANFIDAKLKTVPENVTAAITTATNTLATKVELDALKTEVANKLAGTGGSGKTENKGTGNKGAANNVADAEGWNWGE